jgi:DNA-binding MarR family transcriptional regulator
MRQAQANRTGQLIIQLKHDFKQRLQFKLEQRQVAIRELHGMIVSYVAEHGPCRMVDIASFCEVRPQSMATAIRQLEQLDYLYRVNSKEDLRSKMIALTSSGKTLLTLLDATTCDVWKDYAAIVGQRQLDQALSTIDMLLNAKYNDVFQGHSTDE